MSNLYISCVNPKYNLKINEKKTLLRCGVFNAIFIIFSMFMLNNVHALPLIEFIDSDKDGYEDAIDAFPNDITEWLDTDNDGIGNNADTDDDGDGIADSDDAFPKDPNESLDTDDDGLGNNTDTDDDGDGISDINDQYPLISITEYTDTDGDGAPNDCATECLATGMLADTDDDNDGYLDTQEAGNTAPVITESSPYEITIDEDNSPTAFALTLNATDIDADTLTWSVLSAAMHGTAAASGEGTSKEVTYQPNSHYYGIDQFTVQVSDNTGGFDKILVDIIVNSVNDSPTGQPILNIGGPYGSDVNEGKVLEVKTRTIADDDEVGEFTLVWRSNGSQVGEVGDETYQVQLSDIGNTITVEAQYIDGAGFNELVVSNRTPTVINNPNSDYDNDGLSNQEEDDLGTDVHNSDSDADGVNDSNDTYPLISLNGLTDTDGDGIPDTCDSTCINLGMAEDLYPLGIIYVNDDSACDASNTLCGDTWGNAFPYLHDALAAATTNTQVWVAQGIYYPDDNQAGDLQDDPTAAFVFKQNVTLIGGFTDGGGAENVSDADPEQFMTVLSADITQDDTVEANNITASYKDIVGSNAYSLIRDSSHMNHFSVQGVTLTGVQGDTDNANAYENQSDSAISINHSGATLKHIEAYGNISRYGSVLSTYNNKNCTLTVENLYAANNSTSLESVIHLNGSECESNNFINVTLTNNHGYATAFYFYDVTEDVNLNYVSVLNEDTLLDEYGDAITSETEGGAGALNIANSTFYKVGGINHQDISLNVSHSTFVETQNPITAWLDDDKDAHIQFNSFINNTATHHYSAGIYFNSGSLDLFANVFVGNISGDSADNLYLNNGASMKDSGYNFLSELNSSNGGFINDEGDNVFTHFDSGTSVVSNDAINTLISTTLADNGGDILTLLPINGGALVDVMPEIECSFSNDQRGLLRGFNQACDLGAVEISARDIIDTDGDEIANEFDTDDDGDGLPDSYEDANGLNSLDADDAFSDLDGDHQLNYDEYVHNTNPQDNTDFNTPLNLSFGHQGVANDFTLPASYYDEVGDDEIIFSGLIAELSDQRLVFTGSMYENTEGTDHVFSFMANINGERDTSYADQGLSVYEIGGGLQDFSLAVNEDDQHLIQTDSNTLALIDINGVHDTSFAEDGVLSLARNNNVYTTVAISDGYLVGGQFNNGSSQYGFVAKYQGNGLKDTDYGVNGISKFNELGNGFIAEKIVSIIEQSDGKAIVQIEDAGLVRLNSDGTIDESFVHEIDGIARISGLTLQADGKVLYIDNDSELVRLYSNGSIDTEFNEGNSIELSQFGFYVSGRNNKMIAQLSDNSIIIADISYDNDLAIFQVLKLKANGDIDVSYDNDGIARYVSMEYFSDLGREFVTPILTANGDVVMLTTTCNECDTPKKGVVIRFLTETDSDADGIADSDDAFPEDANETIDTDGDGVGNNADYDDDGDGLPDSYEEERTFLDSLNAADAALDQDNDNYSNLAEFHAVTDPNDIENDPTDSLVYKIISPEGSDFDYFGTAIALSGDTAMVYGHIFNVDFDITRYVYVFNKNADGQWIKGQKLSTEAGDVFNSALAIDGDTALIGGDLDGTGVVFVYKKDDNGNWSFFEKLTALDGGYGGFGTSISLQENTALIGAYGTDDEGNHIGAAYIFEQGEDDLWTEQQKLTADVTQFGDGFAREVSLSGDTALIGAGGDSTNGDLSGAAYIFQKNANQQWQQQAKILPDNGNETDLFAQSISLDGDTALIGAYRTDQAGSSSGSAYIFERDLNNNWLQIAELVADDATTNDQFGYSVSLHGNKALIGARAQDELADYAGASYLFAKSEAGDWNQVDKITAPDAASNELFGSAVILTDNLMVIGTNLEDGDGFGSVYFIDVDTDGDGIGNNADNDDDNDGIEDNDDAFPLDESESFDTDSDGTGNNADTDDDNDGLEDVDDAFPLDSEESVDTDNDGTGNNTDTDDDNDGIADEADASPLDPELGDDQAPVIGDVEVLTFEATSELTHIELVAPEVTDNNANTPTITSDLVGSLALGEHNITWTATDFAGNQSMKTQTIFIEDTTAPEFDVLNVLTLNSKGRLTDISIESDNVAIDIVDGALLAKVVGETALKSGHHEIELRAVDLSGNRANTTLMVDILPEVSISAQRNIEAGGTYHVPFNLSGAAPSYPVDVLYSISLNNEVYDEDSASIDIGTEGEFTITLGAKLTSADVVSINVESSTNAFVGEANHTQLIVIDNNVAPLLDVELNQNGESVSVVDPDNGTVTITATVLDVNQKDTHALTWDVEESAFVDEASDNNILTFEINPENLAEATYAVVIIATENNTAENLQVSQRIQFVVEELVALDTETDSDGDGVIDSDEGYGDSDGDGIADYLDDDSNITRLAIGENTEPMQTSAGLTMSLGSLVASKGSSSEDASLTVDDLAALVGDDAADTQDSHFEAITPLYNFTIAGLTKQGYSVAVVIPLETDTSLPFGAVYRKYNTVNGWFAFVEDENNSVSSALVDENGNCPPANDVSYNRESGVGLVEGDNCFQLIIEDGGPNDADFEVNGSVEDPGVIAIEQQNNSPEIILVENVEVDEESQVTLDASKSIDDDGDTLTYSWVQLSGTLVELTEISTDQLFFTSPSVSRDEVLSFELTVDDGIDSSNQTVHVMVKKVNKAPVVSIDAHGMSGRENTTLTLNATGSDSDGDALSYQWMQISGAEISFDNGTNSQVTITLPEVSADEMIEVEVTVSDGESFTTSVTNFTISNVTEVITVTPEKSSSKSGGSMGMLLLLIVLCRLRKPTFTKIYNPKKN